MKQSPYHFFQWSLKLLNWIIFLVFQEILIFSLDSIAHVKSSTFFRKSRDKSLVSQRFGLLRRENKILEVRGGRRVPSVHKNFAVWAMPGTTPGQVEKISSWLSGGQPTLKKQLLSGDILKMCHTIVHHVLLLLLQLSER